MEKERVPVNESIQPLKTEGVAMMTYTPELKEKVRSAASLWQSFCELPLEQKQLLPANSNGAGSGYEYKDGNGHHADRKENFDVASSHQTHLKALLEQSLGDTERAFVRSALDLTKEMTPLANRFAEQAEAEFNLPGFTEKVANSSDTIFIRFLHYFGDRAESDIIAEPHTDQSGFTFHLFETDSGCQRLDYSTKQWLDMPVVDGKTAVIPAMQLQYESGGELRALTHRVIATEHTKDFGRYAIVCFVRFANSPIYDKNSHGRLQEREPGFNYELSSEEFSKLFTQTPEAS